MENSRDHNSFTVQCKGQHEDLVCFRIEKESKLEKQVLHQSMQFFHKVSRNHPTKTALQAKLKVGLEIDAIMHTSREVHPATRI